MTKDVIFGLLFFALMIVLKGTQDARSQERYLNPPPKYIEYFHFGFKESVADSLWMRWIQDVDVCQTYVKPMEKLPAREVDFKDLTDNPRHKNCDKSWGFAMLDAVTRLDPRFLIPYLAGASSLSILVEDYEGSTVLYERGIKNYPNDWQLLYRASYHFQFDIKDKARAAELLSRAADLGGPTWFKSLAARLLTDLGEIELGLSNLESYRKTIEDGDPEHLEKVDARIAALRSRLKALER